MNVFTFLFLRIVAWCFFGAMTLHAGPAQTGAVFAKGVANEINKIYVHKGPLVHEVVLYCSGQPIVNHIPDADWQKAAVNTSQGTTLERYRFFMPYTSLDQKKFKDTLMQLKQQDGYHISFTSTTTPIKGLECMVLLDPEKIGFQVETFETITGDKAIAFKFVQRDNVKHINHKSHPIIRTAHTALPVKKNFILS